LPAPHRNGPPWRLAAAVGLVAAATLLVEILVTRFASVLFFYHFSFFSISLVMSGLVLGGLVAARWDASGETEPRFSVRLAGLAATLGVGIVVPLFVLARLAPAVAATPTLASVGLFSVLFLPGLVAAGAFLALAFARDQRWIGALYGWDLLGAATGCAGSIWALRTLQGPVSLICPVVLAGLAAALLGWRNRTGHIGLAVCCLGVLLPLLGAGSSLSLLRLPAGDDEHRPLFERWNEHSRIVAFDLGVSRYLVIDRTAGTVMRRIPPKPDGRPVDIEDSWDQGSQYSAYHAMRPVRAVAVIGVGGGGDLLPALRAGARRVDGYELNRTFVDLLERDFRDFNAITSRPEIRLHHTEARVGLAHSSQRYDVIQASMSDTWAATASGGFVLSENALYTRDAWRTFLAHLTETGILTMTRWHLPDAPAETHRLVALAGAALEDAGVRDATNHVVLLRSNPSDTSLLGSPELRSMATLLVSKTAFTRPEVDSLRAWSKTQDAAILTAPGVMPADASLPRLLSAATREEAIDESRFDISVPTDERPYFFLQIRPSDVAGLFRQAFGAVTEITFNGVRVLMVLCFCALVFVASITALVVRVKPEADASVASHRAYRWMTVYFLGIGAGYVLIQLGLHQRLIILLGHPTLALSVVLFSMLLGTGLGAACSGRLFPSERPSRAGLVILATLAALLAGQLLVPLLEFIHNEAVRIGLAGLLVGGIGTVLGFAFPVGIRMIGGRHRRATQHAWAVNGAASIAASALSVLIGIAWGSTGVVACGFVAYAAATGAGFLAERCASPRAA
jgi:hypothetical protein